MKAAEAQTIATEKLLPSLEAVKEENAYKEVIRKIKESAEQGHYNYLSRYLTQDIRTLLSADGFKIKECNLGHQFYITWEPDWYKIV